MEKLKTKIDYQSIAKAYGYKPIPEGFEEVKAVNLKIDWKRDAELRKKQQYEAMEGCSFSLRDRNFDSNIIDSGEIVTDKGNFQLETEVWVNRGIKVPYLRLFLVNERGREIGQCLSSMQKENVWNLHDRITFEAYRGKGIASQMIEATENCVQAYANKTGQEQEIEVEASQLPVLSLFLKQGYEVIDEEKQRFVDTMSKLEVGDNQYVLASCRADFEQNTDNRKTWYVFEREIYEKLGEKIWDSDEFLEKNYMKYSVRFKLRKKILPKYNDVETEIEQVHQQIRLA